VLLAFMCVSAVMLVSLLPELPSLFVLGCGFVVFGSFNTLLYFIFPRCRSAIVLVSVFLCLCCWAMLWGRLQLDNRLSPELEGINIVAEGRVVSLPKQGQHNQRFDFEVDNAFVITNDQEALQVSLPTKIRLSWYHHSAKNYYKKTYKKVSEPVFNKALDEVVAGHWYRFEVRLKRPHGFVNNAGFLGGGFDYERSLLAQGIGASGYVRKQYSVEVTQASANIDSFSLTRLRQNLRQFIQQSLPDFTQAAVVLALGVGDQSLLTDQHRDILQKMGLSHLLAISGLHIGLAATVGLWFGKVLGRILNTLAPARFFTPVIAPLVSLILAFLYAGLAGFSLPTQRAFIMLSVWFGFYCSGRRYSVWLPWWVAMALILLYQPLAHLSIGFWLSFVAVAALINTFHDDYSKPKSALLALAKTQLILFLVLGLLQWHLGLPVSLVSPLINLVAIPYVGLMVVPLLLLALLLFFFDQNWSGEVLALTGLLIEQLWRCLLWFDHQLVQLDVWPWLLFDHLLPLRPVVFLVVIVCLVFMLLPLNRSTRGLAVLTLLGCVMPFFLTKFIVNTTSDAETSEVSIAVLDVGQGLAVVLHLPQQTWLYDVAFGSSSGFSVTNSAVIPYLKTQGINQLNKVIISHSDSDHAGGINDLIAHVDVKNWYFGESEETRELLTKANRRTIAGQSCPRQQFWQIDAVEVWLFGVGVDSSHDFSGNNASCVLLLRYQGRSILLAGDIERERELHLLKQLKPILKKIDVLVVPHHGSKTSSSEALVNFSAARYGVVSAGYLSRYGHPHPKVVQRYEQHNVTLFNTAQDGGVVITIGENGDLQMQTARKMYRRYWR
jgi:competence protein ComEC